MATTKNFLIGALSTTAVALALMSPAKAEIVLSGDPNGWQFGFDGIVNVFAIDTGAASVSGGTSSNSHSASLLNVANGAGGTPTNGSRFSVSDGLLPEVFGFTAHSPDMGGNKVTGRLSLEPGLGNNSGTFNNTSGSTSLEVREAWASIAGKWGEFAAGKMLGIFGSQAILNDITLFGVGAGASTTSQLNTTLGRIGFGYQYASWQANMRYTSPELLPGLKATVGVFEPNTIYTGDAVSNASATTTKYPKFEGGLSWAGKVYSAPVSLWANGMWEEATFAGNQKTVANNTTYNLQGKSVTISGGDFGGKVSIGPVDFVGYGYAGSGLPVNGLQSGVGTGTALGAAFDAAGTSQSSYGYYVQGVYNFGQGTHAGVSYGSTYADMTSLQTSELATNTSATLKEDDLFTAQVWHDINKAFRVVAEYDYTTSRWNDGATQNQNTVAVGIVALW